jgi:hypothetical protein
MSGPWQEAHRKNEEAVRQRLLRELFRIFFRRHSVPPYRSAP